MLLSLLSISLCLLPLYNCHTLTFCETREIWSHYSLKIITMHIHRARSCSNHNRFIIILPQLWFRLNLSILQNFMALEGVIIIWVWFAHHFDIFWMTRADKRIDDTLWSTGGLGSGYFAFLEFSALGRFNVTLRSLISWFWRKTCSRNNEEFLIILTLNLHLFTSLLGVLFAI